MKKEPKPFTADDFRKELVKLLPGYKWTVHRSHSSKVISATGAISSGSNRISTLEVLRRNEDPWYEVCGFGHGTRGELMGRSVEETLARAVRGLQKYYDGMRGRYGTLAEQLEKARKEAE